MAKIYAPNKKYNGVSASVNFKDGVGETNNPHLISWFKNSGYTVEEEKKVPPKKEEPKSVEVDKETPKQTIQTRTTSNSTASRPSSSSRPKTTVNRTTTTNK